MKQAIDFNYKGFLFMNKLILAVSLVVICSYLSNPIQSAEAAGRHKSHSAKAHSNDHHQNKASWYGAEFHGKKTANGERFNMYAMTAAHKTLPLSSYAEVTNLKNHRSVVVRINDRGPFHGRRAMDLSYAAAKKLGIKGIASVQITPLGSNETLALLSQ
ncbi:septal ring lytic transglycosylase RlpA family protein [Methylobacter psychrophilus]|jgi:rare lipoprotein A|uniref:septal ring lytic transglycosylase RlpA family protein n=1 Tax=Methylobacter psychrophilus TaxID=96941 RepID=UPI002948B9FD|nr:septal ring lytic transglycosylase RlpA family protein [Methylobacter psychrophilus]